MLYNNVRSWCKWDKPTPASPKASLHPKTVICIWWYWKGVPYYKFLLESWMINFNKYCSQLDQLKAVLDEKCLESVNRKLIILHQDNARLHVSLMTRQKLLQLDWEVLIHLLYSPDMALSDFHVVQSLQNSLNGKNFSSLKTAKGTCNSSLLKNIKSLGKMELWICLKNGWRW